MHELALCAAIADIVARRSGDRPVTAVRVRIGQLRQVVPETLSFCWTLLVTDTDLQGAVLEVDRVEAVLHCRACGADSAVPNPPAFACSACAGVEVTVAAGEEFDVTGLELAPA